MKNLPFARRFAFALAGWRHAWRSEHSFRTQVGFAVAALIALLVLRPEAHWWALVTLSIVAVLAAELFNTAVEQLADHLHADRHPAIQVVKDCAAGAVLIASVGALCVALALAVHEFFGG
jgi:diacylglycerol kinase (ATP)